MALRRCSLRFPSLATGLLLGLVTLAPAADVVRPAEVTGLSVEKTIPDVSLQWTSVTTDTLGKPETVSTYRIYRGTEPDFEPDCLGGSNRIGTSPVPSFVDPGAAAFMSHYYYLVSAVDGAGNESAAKPSSITAPPVLSGNWTDTTIELNWSPAAPPDHVSGYRVYYGRSSRQYDLTKDVGLTTSTSMTGLDLWVNWYFAVVAIDQDGNESAFSNEYIDCVAGRVKTRAHDDDYICWGASRCPPREGAIQRNDGWQIMVPADLPEGDWTKVTATFTIDSRLCKVGVNGTTDKCGDGNPGGYNPCGDPWDRGAHLFLVLDETCLSNGQSCINPQNLELIRAITPFGTDAPAPDGDGVVPARVLSLDVTPWAPLLSGRKYIGAEIGHYVQAGWHVTSEFTFSKRPEEASTKLPADGIVVVGWGSAPLPAKQVSIPAGATKVMMRIFTTGHGGAYYCDGGSNNGGTCTTAAECPGGECNPCDEFCHRQNRLLKNGTAIWSRIPWNSCGFPLNFDCQNWNACGFPSCMYDRAGWCPGNVACFKDAPCDQDFDFTAKLPPGGTYDLSYDVLVMRGNWSVSLVLYWYN